MQGSDRRLATILFKPEPATMLSEKQEERTGSSEDVNVTWTKVMDR